MKTENKVLACVDQSHFADYVADAAAWAARRMDAPLELLHILDRIPRCPAATTTAAPSASMPSRTCSPSSPRRTRRAARRPRAGPVFLNRLRERAIRRGVEAPDVRQRYGDLEETLVEQAGGVRLFVLGRRGESAETTQRDLGRNVERMVRALSRPILAVTDELQGAQARDDRLRRRQHDPPRRRDARHQPAVPRPARCMC
jgi:nucleotide-binding universal stress UspA family protein